MGYKTSFYEKYYNKFMKFMHKNARNKKVAKSIKTLDFMLPVVIGGAYTSYVIQAYRKYGRDSFVNSIGVPAVSFLAVVGLKRTINAKRPYEKYDFKPLVNRKKSGGSMPSLHTFSAAIIAASVSFYYPAAGLFLWVAAFLIALMRVATGVHHIEDVMVSIMIAGSVEAFMYARKRISEEDFDI